jgi:hypothetical protein
VVFGVPNPAVTRPEFGNPGRVKAVPCPTLTLGRRVMTLPEGFFICRCSLDTFKRSMIGCLKVIFHRWMINN